MNADKLITTIKALRSVSGNAKEFVLRHGDSELLRKVLYYTYNPFYAYGIKNLRPADRNDAKAALIDKDKAVEIMFEVLDALRKRQLTGNEAQFELHSVRNVLNSLGILEPFDCIIDRDLDAGVGVATINKVFPGLIPTFECALARDFESKRAVWPMLAEVKYDGKRILAVISEGTVTLYSRNGRVEPKYHHIREELKEWADDACVDNVVIDGELMWGMFGKRNEIDAKFVVFDMLTLEEWTKKQCRRTLKDRNHLIFEYFWDAHTMYPHLQLTESRIVKTYEEALKFYEEVVAAGGEGIMLKRLNSFYAFKRTHDWMKMKPVKDVDLPIVGVFEGEGKYQGMLGGIIVDYKGKKVRVGSGFSDYDRGRAWNGEVALVGKTAEIRYTEVTPDGSLRFPRFVRVRDDK